MNPPHRIEVLPNPPGDSDIDGLAEVLLDAVESGASVSFMRGLSRDEARAFWRGCCSGTTSVLVARDSVGIAGTVQLQPAWAPNQPHRAEVAKLIVHRRARRQGLGEALMHAVETLAWESGRTLLTLDAVPGGNGARLYARLGWVEAGSIPGYALDPDGALTDTTVFYKPRP